MLVSKYFFLADLTYDDFVNELSEAEGQGQCRYAVFDAEYRLTDGQKRSKLVFIYWFVLSTAYMDDGCITAQTIKYRDIQLCTLEVHLVLSAVSHSAYFTLTLFFQESGFGNNKAEDGVLELTRLHQERAGGSGQACSGQRLRRPAVAEHTRASSQIRNRKLNRDSIISSALLASQSFSTFCESFPS